MKRRDPPGGFAEGGLARVIGTFRRRGEVLEGDHPDIRDMAGNARAAAELHQ